MMASMADCMARFVGFLEVHGVQVTPQASQVSGVADIVQVAGGRLNA